MLPLCDITVENMTRLEEGLTLEELNYLQKHKHEVIKSVETLYELQTSTESIGSFLSETKSFLAQGFNKFANFFSKTFSKTPNPIPQFYKIEDYQKTAKKIISSGDYSRVVNNQYDYIMGCKLFLQDMFQGVLRASEDHATIVKEVMADLDLTVSELLSDQDKRTSIKPFVLTDKMKLGVNFHKKVEEFQAKAIAGDGYQDKQELYKIIPNFNVLKEIDTYIEDIRKNFSESIFSSTLKEIESLSLKTKELARQIEKKEITCSKQALSSLKDSLTIGANVSTSLATLYYLAGQCALAYKNLIQHLNEDLK